MDNFFIANEKYYMQCAGMKVTATEPEDIRNKRAINHCLLVGGGHIKKTMLPVIFKNDYTYKTLRSFLFSPGGRPLLISSKFKALLEYHQITGWKSYPAHLFNDNGQEIPEYHGFSITGRCGPRDRSKVTIVKKEVLPGKFWDIHCGIFLNPKEWDGSDICLEYRYWDMILSPKAAKVFKKQKAYEIIPVLEYQQTGFIYKICDDAWKCTGRVWKDGKPTSDADPYGWCKAQKSGGWLHRHITHSPNSSEFAKARINIDDPRFSAKINGEKYIEAWKKFLFNEGQVATKEMILKKAEEMSEKYGLKFNP